MEGIESWAHAELRKREDARMRVRQLLTKFRQAATLPLLQDTLSEQLTVNARQQDRIARMTAAYRSAESDPAPQSSDVAAAMVVEAMQALEAVEGLPQDVVIVQHAVRVEHWELGVWRGLAAVFRMLMADDVADEIEALIAELAAAERHLASLGTQLVGDPEGESHDHRLTPRHPYRSPLHQGPTE